MDGGSVVLVEASCALQPRAQTTDFGTAFVGAATVTSTVSASPIRPGRIVTVAVSTPGACEHRRPGRPRRRATPVDP